MAHVVLCLSLGFSLGYYCGHHSLGHMIVLSVLPLFLMKLLEVARAGFLEASCQS